MWLSYTAGYLNCSRWSCTSLQWLEVMLDAGRWCRHGGDQCPYWETTHHHEETEQVPTGWWGNPRTCGLFPWVVERLLLQQLHFWPWESGIFVNSEKHHLAHLLSVRCPPLTCRGPGVGHYV